MKALRIIGSPVAIICMFLLIMISGEAFGGPYLLYLILGLPHGADYAVTGIGGIVLLLVGRKFNMKSKVGWLNHTLCLVGILLLIASLFFFFSNDRLRYNYDTFVSTVPVFTLVLFGITVTAWIVKSCIDILRPKSDSRGHVSLNHA